mmetsp:Transcript_112359/g.328510  ORF Transcript_112359/g.328510 Transcript_112359/m.328510 type:complete len:239 (-) Transcript_112359:705-1421(-)
MSPALSLTAPSVPAKRTVAGPSLLAAAVLSAGSTGSTGPTASAMAPALSLTTPSVPATRSVASPASLTAVVISAGKDASAGSASPTASDMAPALSLTTPSVPATGSVASPAPSAAAVTSAGADPSFGSTRPTASAMAFCAATRAAALRFLRSNRITNVSTALATERLASKYSSHATQPPSRRQTRCSSKPNTSNKMAPTMPQVPISPGCSENNTRHLPSSWSRLIVGAASCGLKITWE